MADTEWFGAGREAGAVKASALLRHAGAAARTMRRLTMAVLRLRRVAALAMVRAGLRAVVAGRRHFLEGGSRRGGARRRGGQQGGRRESGREKRQAKQPGHFGEVLIRMAVDDG
jgi:hypothetical protein